MVYETISFVDDVPAISAGPTSVGGWMKQPEYLEPVSNNPGYIATCTAPTTDSPHVRYYSNPIQNEATYEDANVTKKLGRKKTVWDQEPYTELRTHQTYSPASGGEGQYATATTGPRVVQEEGYSGLDGSQAKYVSARAAEEGYAGLNGSQATYSSADYIEPISGSGGVYRKLPGANANAEYSTIANDSPGTYHTLKDMQV